REFHGGAFVAMYPFLSSSALPTRREGIVSVLATDVALVVAVNSAAHTQDGNLPVFISQPLLDAMGEHIHKNYGDAPQLRIFVLHHHLLPFVENPWGPSFNFRNPPEKMDATMLANS